MEKNGDKIDEDSDSGSAASDKPFGEAKPETAEEPAKVDPEVKNEVPAKSEPEVKVDEAQE